jgi:post-segregation antitoxin (ccd killing protein)
MFRKGIPVQRRNTQAIITHVTIPVRRSIEKLCRKADISISEATRRALTEFVAKNTEEQVEV